MARQYSDYDQSYTFCSDIQAEARHVAAQDRLARRLRDAGTPGAPRRFRHARLLLAGLCLALLLLGSTAVLVQARGLGVSSRIYTVAAIQAGLRHAPAAWVGRTVRVRAVLAGCRTWSGAPGASACVDRRPALLDAGRAVATGPLPLAWGTEHPVLAWLRALPVVGGMLPGPQVPVWGAATTYLVRIEVERPAAHGMAPRWQALLLDSGSWDTPQGGGGPRGADAPRAR